MKKYSLLNLALLATSGFASAIAPSKKAEPTSNLQQVLNGVLVISTGTSTKLTCTLWIVTYQDCDWSETYFQSATTNGVLSGATSDSTPLDEFGDPNPTFTAGYTTTYL